MKNPPPIIAVDFDGTLCEHKFPEIGEPNAELFDCIKKLKKEGWKIILWTCRSGEYLRKAIAWCEERGLTFDAVNEDLPSIKDSVFGREKSCKVYATFYVDDRNININQFINGKDITGTRKCRVCGCTNAKACIDNDGVPCHWVSEDLCSACAE